MIEQVGKCSKSGSRNCWRTPDETKHLATFNKGETSFSDPEIWCRIGIKKNL